jgi:tRNA1(Val) A37 N6-methylase TrmN6
MSLEGQQLLPVHAPPGDSITIDRLAGDWTIHQLKRGHRFSTDDLMTAWTAAHCLPSATEQADIGSGIGSVGLLTLWRLQQFAPQCTTRSLVTVEVQSLSAALAQRTVRANGLESIVHIHRDDLRTSPVLQGQQTFELVTGSPPYIPPSRGVQSPHPQKAAARIELHGSVYDYCEAAARVLRQNGRFVFCHAAADPRPEAAVVSSGLQVYARRNVQFRSDQPPLIALYECGWPIEGRHRIEHPTFIIRDSSGLWTDEYLTMREDMGTVVWNPT